MRRLFGSGRWIYWVLGLSLLFNAAVLATFLLGPRLALRYRWPGHHEPPLVELKKELGLDDDQWRQFVESRRKLHEKVRSIRKEMQQERKKLWELMAADHPDRGAIANATEVIARLQKQIQDVVIEEMLKLRAGLLPWQRERFDEHFRRRICKGGPMCDGGCMSGERKGERPGGGPAGKHRRMR